MFKLNLYIPLILLTVIMSFSTIFTVFYFQEKTIHKDKKFFPKEFHRILNAQIKAQSKQMSEFIKFIKKDKDIQKAFISKNKEELFYFVKDVYKSLNENVAITHMYFIQTDGKVLLRAHDYDRDQDIVERFTFLQAKQTKRIFYGLEFGIKKNYTLRVVEPWFVDGKLIGYIEIGREIDVLMNQLSDILNTHIYMLVKKDVFSNSPEFVKKRLSNKISTKDYYIVYNTGLIPQKINEIVEDRVKNPHIAMANKTYHISKSILSDVSGKNLGYFVFLTDVTSEHLIMSSAIRVLIILIVIMAFLVLISGFIILKRKEKHINSLTFAISKQKENLVEANKKLQKLFDLQSNIIVLTDSREMVMANKIFFDFFGYKNLSEFFIDYHCICEKFIENNSFFHLGKVAEQNEWVEDLKKLPQKERIVSMIDQFNNHHIFKVSINEFNKGEHIISFTDISDTWLEQGQLKYKVSHDMLTNAYSREFFDYNIEKIINEVHYPNLLGVVMCDIDYFKTVNDTYGHKRGDEVLKSLVEVIKRNIRKEDYIIRWGGEEFLILLHVDSIESLFKIIENARKNIEKEYFEEVEHITCSFGISIHLKNYEDIMVTFERADKALYVAKDSGRNRVEVLNYIKG